MIHTFFILISLTAIVLSMAEDFGNYYKQRRSGGHRMSGADYFKKVMEAIGKTAPKTIDFNRMQWKPVYNKTQVYFHVTSQTGRMLLNVSVEGYHTEEYDLAELMLKIPMRPDELNTTTTALLRIFEYLLANALFPYPMEELA